MSKDSEKIDEIFQIHENETKTGTRSQSFSKIHMKTGLLNSEEQEWADEEAAEEQEIPQERYHPIQRRDRRFLRSVTIRSNAARKPGQAASAGSCLRFSCSA